MLSPLSENYIESYRLTAVIATCFCLAGGLIFTRYRERDVLKTIDGNAPREPEGKDGE